MNPDTPLPRPAEPLPIPGTTTITNERDREPNRAVNHIIAHFEAYISRRQYCSASIDFRSLDRQEKAEWTAALYNNPPWKRLELWAIRQKLKVEFDRLQSSFTITYFP